MTSALAAPAEPAALVVPETVEEEVPAAESVEEEQFPDSAGMLAIESEIVFSPEVLESPVPGAGWEPSAAFLREDAELGELLPVMPEDVRPYEGPQVGEKDTTPEDHDTWMAAGWPEIAETAAAESAAAFNEEVRAAEQPVAETQFAETQFTGQPVTDEGLTEREFEQADVFEAEETRKEQPSPPAPSSEPAMPFLGAAGPVAQAEPSGVAAEAALGDDLKSRIEETRRRIREELERPFAAVDQEPVPAEARPPVSGLAPPPATDDDDTMQVAAAAFGAVPEQPTAAAQVSTDGNGSDYDAMRARIELTRSRLKAKAFDAMMAGESALLGRNPGDELVSPPAHKLSVDSEIEQTVDNTLREEDR